MATFSLSRLYLNHNFLLLLILYSTIYYSLLVDCIVSGAESYHVVSVQSLIPKKECSSFQEPSKLKIVNRHGPCSHSTTKLAHEDILHSDQLRAQWLNSKSSTKPKNPILTSKIPARKGTSVGAGNYIVEIALGTPEISQTVLFDTGSDTTWVQCQPCTSQCYPQQDPLFDPSKSSTYSNISCTSPSCTSLTPHGCSESTTCLYQILYGDGSSTVGFFAQDTLTLGSDTVPNFRFGCGEKNSGLFGKAAGLLGLGRKPSSVVMQTTNRYGGVFAYCLPAMSSSAGYLTFGRSRVRSDVRYTPMLSRPGMKSFYFLELTSMSVGGQRLNIDPTVFEGAGSIIDTGTVITRMPPAAYAELRKEFRSQMTGYPLGQEVSILDTCYDLSGFDTVKIPKLAFEFRGATVNLDPMGIFYVVSAQQFCLGFAANGMDDHDLMIIGNTQQRRLDVVYDVGNKLVGFGAGGC